MRYVFSQTPSKRAVKLHIFKPQILVAEDNRVMGNVMRFNLLRAGFDVTMVHDGRAALRQLEHKRFDMVVTDYQMPHASGQDVCRYVRDESMCPEIPVVLVSAKGIELRQSLAEEGEAVDAGKTSRRASQNETPKGQAGSNERPPER